MPAQAAQTEEVVRGDIENCRAHLRTHYRRLGRSSRRLRFMAEHTADAIDAIASHASPDLMLEIVSEGAVRGILEAYEAAGGHVEIALSVEDRYQGRGLGRTLFEAGLRLLSQRDFRTADLHCLRENTAVLHLIRQAGGRIEVEGSEVHAEIDLGRMMRLQAGSDPGHATRQLEPA